MAEQGMETANHPRRLRVLIVDDNRDAADSLSTLATFWGCEVRSAYDGRTALATARTFLPDCLILDIGLPEMDGYTVARQLRAEPLLARTRLVALTAYGSEEDRERAWAAGFHLHLVKPAEPDVLQRYLNMLEQALRLAERTESLAQQNIQLAMETKELLSDVKEEIQEVKEELREVKQDLKEVKRKHPDD